MFIRQLNYLVALEREKHFGRAAAACHVSQPALSGAIRGIEEELGVAIVLRGRRFEGFTLDGERVLAWARRVLADCENLRQEARTGEDGPHGTLRLGSIPAALPLLPRLLQACLQRHRGIRHQLHTLSAAETLRRLSNFELDIGVSYLDDERLDRYDTLPIFRERYVIVSAEPDAFVGLNAMPWHQAAQLPLCLFPDNLQCRRGIDSAFDAAGVQIAPLVETDSMTALCAHVRRAGLYSILPHSVLCLDDTPGRLYALPMVPQLQRDIGLVMRRQSPRSPILAAALDCLQDLRLQEWVDALLTSGSAAHRPAVPASGRTRRR